MDNGYKAQCITPEGLKTRIRNLEIDNIIHEYMKAIRDGSYLNE